MNWTELLTPKQKQELDAAYKIEHNVPIPHQKSNGLRGRWTKLADEMQDGDSVLVNGIQEARALRTAILKTGFRCVSRDVDSKTPRVWKLSNENTKADP